MALQSSGAITFNNINVELGLSGTTQASLGQATFRTLAGVSSGAISMSNFYGKSNETSISVIYAGTSSYREGVYYTMSAGSYYQPGLSIGGAEVVFINSLDETLKGGGYFTRLRIVGSVFSWTYIRSAAGVYYYKNAGNGVYNAVDNTTDFYWYASMFPTLTGSSTTTIYYA